MAKKLTSAKAKEILHDKSVHGHPLTDKQRRFFGAIASGSPIKAKSGGWLDSYQEGGVESRQAGYTDIPFNYNSAWGGQFQDGGKLTDEQLSSLNRAKMKAKMALASEFGNPAAKRMTMYQPPTYTFQGNEMIGGKNIGVPFGEKGTHFMGSMENYAVPYVQQDVDGEMMFNPNASPMDREAIRFDNPEDAAYFSEHYKEVAPMMRSFAMGGNLPGSVGFTYARTQGIPSEGPYAKKTMPSAQDGMTYYQHGLDWKPRNISRDGSVIKDDRGQWAHPGKITEIQGDTMATHGYGDLPLYVIPDVGEPRVVEANTGTHTFPGATKFTEIPMKKNGGWLNKYK